MAEIANLDKFSMLLFPTLPLSVSQSVIDNFRSPRFASLFYNGP